MTCLFCEIAQGKISANIAWEDDTLVAFYDIRPQAPTHLLIIPKEHISTIDEVKASHGALIGNMVLTANHLAKTLELSDKGYRLVFNVNQDGGQEVYHIHLHLLGGRPMKWPPG